ncbi:hypothetical protein GLOIN_2v1544692 [Rhizophagus irregularis DAOM 181602=DAOM 197198]|nr:hypothetical protein GLOIN_2v1544692 [Rhizophagus irregularis DAOM 181602=DAOM 197198]
MFIFHCVISIYFVFKIFDDFSRSVFSICIFKVNIDYLRTITFCLACCLSKHAVTMPLIKPPFTKSVAISLSVLSSCMPAFCNISLLSSTKAF